MSKKEKMHGELFHTSPKIMNGLLLLKDNQDQSGPTMTSTPRSGVTRSLLTTKLGGLSKTL